MLFIFLILVASFITGIAFLHKHIYDKYNDGEITKRQRRTRLFGVYSFTIILTIILTIIVLREINMISAKKKQQ